MHSYTWAEVHVMCGPLKAQPSRCPQVSLTFRQAELSPPNHALSIHSSVISARATASLEAFLRTRDCVPPIAQSGHRRPLTMLGRCTETPGMHVQELL